MSEAIAFGWMLLPVAIKLAITYYAVQHGGRAAAAASGAWFDVLAPLFYMYTTPSKAADEAKGILCARCGYPIIPGFPCTIVDSNHTLLVHVQCPEPMD